jgi:hypothetical protein
MEGPIYYETGYRSLLISGSIYLSLDRMEDCIYYNGR